MDQNRAFAIRRRKARQWIGEAFIPVPQMNSAIQAHLNNKEPPKRGFRFFVILYLLGNGLRPVDIEKFLFNNWHITKRSHVQHIKDTLKSRYDLKPAVGNSRNKEWWSYYDENLKLFVDYKGSNIP